ncbi:hypothetical protein G3446_10165 [Thiorhodococcus minor]|uniref:Uncharacterized protein n=1 Tax=Thiorhodococcus minor TaxID=57489 RepID=A0A6M0JYX8_9GAMM|nr:hypothetical protein [Thiorhodococcus minor]
MIGHPAGFEGRLGFLPLEHRDRIAQLLDGFRLPSGRFGKRFDQLQQLLDERGTRRVGDVWEGDRSGHAGSDSKVRIRGRGNTLTDLLSQGCHDLLRSY